MPINIKMDAVYINDGDSYIPLDAIYSGDINAAVNRWLAEHPEATTPDNSLSYKKLVVGTLGFVTPEMYGAYGDGVNDDTEAFQSALNSGIAVIAPNSYNISAINVKDTSLTIYGTILGQVIINNDAFVTGGTIQQNTNDPCVIFESAISGRGYLNGRLSECKLIPTSSGVGIKFSTSNQPLFGYVADNLDITSCYKSIWIYNSRWTTKGTIENVYCHTPTYAIFIDNLAGTNTYCADITIKNVYAQYANNKPLSFLKLNSGNCIISLEDSFCYDGIKECIFDLSGSTGDTRIFITGRLHNDIASAKFTNATNLQAFYILGESTTSPSYIKLYSKTELPKDYYGSAYFETFSSPALNNNPFFGMVGRAGVINGADEPNKIFGLGMYDGRLSILRSTDGTITNGNVIEVSTPYSGGIYTSSTLPTSVRNGAKCWCSDIKMDVTYYNGVWYKPDGTVLS